MKASNLFGHQYHEPIISSYQMARICDIEHQIVFDDIQFMLSMLGEQIMPYLRSSRDDERKNQVEYVLPYWLAMEWAAGYDRSRSDPLLRYLLRQDDSLYSPVLLALLDDVAELKAQLEPLED